MSQYNKAVFKFHSNLFQHISNQQIPDYEIFHWTYKPFYLNLIWQWKALLYVKFQFIAALLCTILLITWDRLIYIKQLNNGFKLIPLHERSMKKKIKSTQMTFPHVLQLLKNIKNLRKSISTIGRTHLLKFDYQPKNRFFSYNKFSRFWLQELIDSHTQVRQQWKLFPSDQREKFSLFKKLLWIYLLF